jgi:thiamine pyrophosphate-dependent acetolactate synthase large subunit-like protein
MMALVGDWHFLMTVQESATAVPYDIAVVAVVFNNQKSLAAGRPAAVEVTIGRKLGTSGGQALGWWDVPVPTD